MGQDTTKTKQDNMKVIVVRWPDGTVTLALDREYTPDEVEPDLRQG